MVFHWSLSDSRSPQVSRTLLIILTDLNAVIGMVLIRPLISNSFSPFTKPLGTVLSAPITIGITVTLMLHSFLNSLARSKYLSLVSFSLIFTLSFAGTANFSINSTIFVDYHLVWSSGRDSVICMYLKIPGRILFCGCPLFHFLQVFSTSSYWWLSLSLQVPKTLWVFRPITMLWFAFFWFSIPSVFFPSLW